MRPIPQYLAWLIAATIICVSIAQASPKQGEAIIKVIEKLETEKRPDATRKSHDKEAINRLLVSVYPEHEIDVSLCLWLGLGALGLLITICLHNFSLGRTSPWAAAGFFVCGPVVGVAITLYYAGKEAGWRTSDLSPVEIDLGSLWVKVICAGLIGSAIVAIFVASEFRDEWFNHRRRID